MAGLGGVPAHKRVGNGASQLPLEHLRPLFLKCGKCGAEFRYKTNITDKYITHTCVKCGAPVDMMLNTRETAYVTIGERKEFRRNGKD